MDTVKHVDRQTKDQAQKQITESNRDGKKWLLKEERDILKKKICT